MILVNITIVKNIQYTFLKIVKHFQKKILKHGMPSVWSVSGIFGH